MIIESTDQTPALPEEPSPCKGERPVWSSAMGSLPFRRACLGIGLILTILQPGCGIAPKGFKSLNSPAAIVRARSVGLANHLPDARVIPALIDRLNDTDPVVRLSAYEELKKRTGQDFGFVPWGQPAERVQAVERWKQWWEGQKPALARNRQNP